MLSFKEEQSLKVLNVLEASWENTRFLPKLCKPWYTKSGSAK